MARRGDARAGNELLLLWAILGEGGGKDVSRASLHAKGMLPSDDRKARDGLEKRGLVTVERRTSKNEAGRAVSGTWITVTRAGVAWAEENLAAMPARSQAAAPILQEWLTRLSVFLHMRALPVAEFLRPHHAAPVNGVAPSRVNGTAPPLGGGHDDLRARIRRAYLDVTAGRFSARALLRDLRHKLRDIDRPALDEALKQMQIEDEASLYQLDNRTEITDADRAAAIHFGGEPRHILWIER